MIHIYIILLGICFGILVNLFELLVSALYIYFKELKSRKFPFKIYLHMKLKDIRPLVIFAKSHDLTFNCEGGADIE